MNDDFEIVKQIMKQPLSMKHHFQFECSRCGRCCTTISAIHLTPYDIYCLAAHLHKPVEDFIDGYCELKVTEGSVVPAVFIRLNGSTCPFHTADGCTVYEARPFICRLYPLGYIYSSLNQRAYYFEKDEAKGHCIGVGGKSYKLKFWLRENDAHITYSWKWFEKNYQTFEAMQDLELGESAHGVIARLIDEFSRLYFEYDIGKPFDEQYRAHERRVDDFIAAQQSRFAHRSHIGQNKTYCQKRITKSGRMPVKPV